MLENLTNHKLWDEFLEYKTSRKLLMPGEEKYYREYIENKKYLSMAGEIVSGRFSFSIPEKKEINKMGTSKKRIVYCFTEEENMILKMLSYLLYKYDNALSSNCYSFRKNIGARKAFMEMAGIPGISNMYGFKADISNYFNSIDVSLLLPILADVITDDKTLLSLLTNLLQDNRAIWQDKTILESKGVMAGTPTSPFLANIYLKEMDQYFAKKNVLYARYSDDIIIFAQKEEIEEHIDAFREFLEKYHLKSNPSKERYFFPGEKWDFLGFSYENGIIDISDAAIRKIMDKIRRQAKSLRRWMIRKEATHERTLRAYNRKFNRKFYDTEPGRELCWCRWYFPMINTAGSLHSIDRYMQDWQRYIVTGKHNKANYRKVPYAMLVENGYRPLVPAYYGRYE